MPERIPGLLSDSVVASSWLQQLQLKPGLDKTSCLDLLVSIENKLEFIKLSIETHKLSPFEKAKSHILHLSPSVGCIILLEKRRLEQDNCCLDEIHTTYFVK